MCSKTKQFSEKNIAIKHLKTGEMISREEKVSGEEGIREDEKR